MKAAIVGVTGYTGIELVRLIHQHPSLTLGTLHSHSMHKNSISELYPHLQQLCGQEVEAYDAEKIMKNNDLVFFATPSGISKDLVHEFVAKDFPVIDLSGDLRLKDLESYQRWYKKEPTTQEIVDQAVYALPEFSPIKGNLLSNPGCYATAAILSLVPLIQAQLIALDTIILDGKSGLSGAGKQLSDSSHYVTVDENMTLYKLNQHQHIPEIIQYLQSFDADLTTLQFTTSLIPIKRGIFMTLYAKVKEGVTNEQIQQAFDVYQTKPFVRVQSNGRLPELRQVTGTNFCDIGFGLNEENQTLTVVAVIDNLMKGAAGQAIQNFNLWAGLDETCGLTQVPLFP